MARLAERMARLGTENAFNVGEHIRRAEAAGRDVIRFNLGEPDFDSAAHINAEAIRQINAGNAHYTDPRGIRPLREAVAQHIFTTRGITVDPDQVVVTPGAKPPIGHAMQTYVDPGDEVIYPSPGFPIYESWVTYVGAVPRPLHVAEAKEFQFGAEDVAALMTDRTRLLILNSPSNPTGGVLSAGELDEIADAVTSRGSEDLRVFSDEVYEHILFDERSHVSIASQRGMADRTVMVGGHSKSYAMTGWRLGWAVLPSVVEADAFVNLNINTVSCVPPFIQEAGRVALEASESTLVVDEMVAAFTERRDWVVPALNQIDGVTCQTPKGAFYVFPNIGAVCDQLGAVEAWEQLSNSGRAATSPSGMFQMFLLYRYGVATMDRDSFGSIGTQGQHFLRISIANSLDQIKEGISRMAAAAVDVEGFGEFLRTHPVSQQWRH